MAKKLTPTQKIQRALRALDTAVQEWYQENNPDNKERYADATIFETDDGYHVRRITLNSDAEGKQFIDIK